MDSGTGLTLCAPTPELTCFGCCPPIRPAHYDPLKYVGSLRREFVENRERFFKEEPRCRPIVGYHCWALGFLDTRGRRVGCLLHPFQNNGRDLRFMIDYGTKCERESCLPGREFSALPPEGQRFWLPLAQGLSSFYYSSRLANPLFHLLLWGRDVLERVRGHAEEKGWSVAELVYRRGFLLDSSWKPRSHRYLFRLILEKAPPDEEGKQIPDPLGRKLLARTHRLPEIRQPIERSSPGIPTYKLPLETDYLDFLRLGLGWLRTSLDPAVRLKLQIERMVRELVEGNP